MTDVVLVLTTLDAEADGPAFALALVQARVAACVTILAPMVSVYRWKECVEQRSEQQLVIKTTAEQVEPLKAWLGANHSYSVPEVLVLPVSGGGAAYLAWLTESVG
jgi:periplasmic divalent cation tolerance protein